MKQINDFNKQIYIQEINKPLKDFLNLKENDILIGRVIKYLGEKNYLINFRGNNIIASSESSLKKNKSYKFLVKSADEKLFLKILKDFIYEKSDKEIFLNKNAIINNAENKLFYDFLKKYNIVDEKYFKLKETILGNNQNPALLESFTYLSSLGFNLNKNDFFLINLMSLLFMNFNLKDYNFIRSDKEKIKNFLKKAGKTKIDIKNFLETIKEENNEGARYIGAKIINAFLNGYYLFPVYMHDDIFFIEYYKTKEDDMEKQIFHIELDLKNLKKAKITIKYYNRSMNIIIEVENYNENLCNKYRDRIEQIIKRTGNVILSIEIKEKDNKKDFKKIEKYL